MKRFIIIGLHSSLNVQGFGQGQGQRHCMSNSALYSIHSSLNVQGFRQGPDNSRRMIIKHFLFHCLTKVLVEGNWYHQNITIFISKHYKMTHIGSSDCHLHLHLIVVPHLYLIYNSLVEMPV